MYIFSVIFLIAEQIEHNLSDCGMSKNKCPAINLIIIFLSKQLLVFITVTLASGYFTICNFDIFY